MFLFNEQNVDVVAGDHSPRIENSSLLEESCEERT